MMQIIPTIRATSDDKSAATSPSIPYGLRRIFNGILYISFHLVYIQIYRPDSLPDTLVPRVVALLPSPYMKPIASLCALRSATRLLKRTSALRLSPPSILRPLFNSHIPSVTVITAAFSPFTGSA